jgi:hypothetical protein
LNIFVITVSLDFRGTPFVVAPMLLAVLYLCAWDYDRFRGLLTTTPLGEPVPAQRLDRWETLGFSIFAVALIQFFGFTRNFFDRDLARVCLATGVAAGLFTLSRFVWARRHAAAAARRPAAALQRNP